MSFLKGLGGPLAGGLGGAITPLSGLGQIGGPMSGIGLLSRLFGKGDGGEGESSPQPAAPAAPAAPQPNAAASGLGRLIGADPARISSIADSVGKGMNMIAQGGGAQGGYAAPEQAPLPAVNNHMQLLDPKILQALVQHFSGGGRGQIQ